VNCLVEKISASTWRRLCDAVDSDPLTHGGIVSNVPVVPYSRSKPLTHARSMTFV
jgi:hypothetical protein